MLDSCSCPGSVSLPDSHAQPCPAMECGVSARHARSRRGSRNGVYGGTHANGTQEAVAPAHPPALCCPAGPPFVCTGTLGSGEARTLSTLRPAGRGCKRRRRGTARRCRKALDEGCTMATGLVKLDDSLKGDSAWQHSPGWSTCLRVLQFFRPSKSPRKDSHHHCVCVTPL